MPSQYLPRGTSLPPTVPPPPSIAPLPTPVGPITEENSITSNVSEAHNGRKWQIDTEGRHRGKELGTYFPALTYQKRAMGDKLGQERREQFNDQRPEASWLGGYWNSWVRGGGMGSTHGYGSKNVAGFDAPTSNSVRRAGRDEGTKSC